MIKNNLNIEKVEVVNDWGKMETGFYLDPKIAEKINKRINLFFKGLFGKLESSTLDESTKDLVFDLIANKLFNEVLYLIEPKLKDNLALDILSPKEQNSDTGADYILKKPEVAVGSSKDHKKYFPAIKVTDPELYLAIEVVMSVPTLLLNIISKNTSEIRPIVIEYVKKIRELENLLNESRNHPTQIINSEKEKFIKKLRKALLEISKTDKKFTQKNVYELLEIKKSTFQDIIKAYNILHDKKTKLFIDMETGLQI
jgi:hypothetical protein